MTKLLIGFCLGILAAVIIRFVVNRIRGTKFVQRGFDSIEFENLNIFGVIEKMELKEGQRVKCTVTPKTAHGHAAQVEPGSARFTSADESVIAVGDLIENPDGSFSTYFENVDGTGNQSIAVEFRADGKVGEGIREIVVAGVIVATQGDAVVGEMAFDTPEDVTPEPQPEPASGDELATPADNAGSDVVETESLETIDAGGNPPPDVTPDPADETPEPESPADPVGGGE